MDHILPILKHYKSMAPIYGAMLLFSLHFFLISFLNSSLLSEYWSNEGLSFLFTGGAILSLFLLIYAGKVVRKYNAYTVFLVGIILEFIGVLIITFSHTAYMVGTGFLLTYISAPLIFYAFDIFLEIVNTNESETGRVRSIFMTVSSLILVISPFVATQILFYSSYNAVYAFSALFLIPLFFVAHKYFKKLKAPKQAQAHSAMFNFLKNNKLRRVFEAKLVLTVFYAVMIIYLPIHLNITNGFSWDEIGLILTIMLLPFLLFEIPLGTLADKYFGEKEIMAIGFLITSGSMFALHMFDDVTLWGVAALLFISRVGASAIEIMTESYFFKQVSCRSSEFISFFRLSIPISFIIAPLFYGFFIDAQGTNHMFIMLAFTMLLGIIPSLLIEDTK
jgi:MFS family permease